MSRTTNDLLPRHAQAHVALTRLVGGLTVGDRLPPERDLALQLGVSRVTVRRALQTLISDGVLHARQGSGTYLQRQPPAQARSATGLIGLSVPTVEWPTIAQIVSGVESAAQGLGLRVVLAHDHGDPTRQLAQLAALRADGVDGLLLFLDRDNVSRPDVRAALTALREATRNIVLLDRPVPGIDLPCVMTDTFSGMYQLTRHLLAQGRRRLAVVSWGAAAGTAEQHRLAGFRAALLEYGLPAAPVRHAEVGYGDDPVVAAERAVAGWLTEKKPPPFDAIVCFFDPLALGAFRALQRAGIRVPQQVALTGFDHVTPELYRALGLDLTTVEQPCAQLGRVALTRLADRLAGKASESGPAQHTLLAPTLHLRGSTGATPDSASGR